jgi:hypothetical protein
MHLCFRFQRKFPNIKHNTSLVHMQTEPLETFSGTRHNLSQFCLCRALLLTVNSFLNAALANISIISIWRFIK